MAYHHRERQTDFSGGYNDRDNDVLLQDNESPDMCNTDLGKRGTFSVRPGTALMRSDPVSAAGVPVTSVYEFINRNGVEMFLACAGTSLKKAIVGGWQLLRDTFTDGSYFEFITNALINMALLVNGEDGYYETDGVTCDEVVPYAPTPDELTEIGACFIPTKPKLIEYHHYRTWLGNVDGYPDRVYCCVDDINGNTLYNYFTTYSWYRASSSKGEGITAIKSFKERLYVFTRTSIKVISGKDIDEFVMFDLFNTVGAVSSRTIWEVDGYLIFLAVDGVYMFDGQNPPMKVSIRIPETINRISTAHRHLSAGAAWMGKYFLSIPESTVNDLTMVYDTDVVPLTYIGDKHSYANSPWMPHRGYVPCQWIVRNDLNLYFGATDGYVYQYGVGDTDGGSAIEAYYTTKFLTLNAPDRVKRVRNVRVEVRPVLESFMLIEYMTEKSSDWERLKQANLGVPSDTAFIPFPNGRGPVCRKFRLKFSTVYTGSKFSVEGYVLDMAVRGNENQSAGKE